MSKEVETKSSGKGSGICQYRRSPKGDIHAVYVSDDGTILAVSQSLSREQIEGVWLQEQGYLEASDSNEAATLLSAMNADPAQYPVAEECATFSLDRAHTVPGLD